MTRFLPEEEGQRRYAKLPIFFELRSCRNV